METKQEANTGSDAATCSPSSGTPETDDLECSGGDNHAPWRLARKMERERNVARRELREIFEAVSLSSFLPGDAYEWLQSHPENADVDARRDGV
jgi:hypothetical protein